MHSISLAPPPSDDDDATSPQQATGDDAMRPLTWDDYIGQTRMKDRLRLAIDATRNSGRPMSPVLLTGPPGMGKTSIATLIASELGYTLHVTKRRLSAAAVTSEILCHDRGPGSTPVVWFIDEIHTLPTLAQEALLPVVEDRQYESPWGPEPCPWLTIVAATTERAKVIEPLRDRFRIDPPFDPYSVDDMTAIVAGMADRTDVTLPHHVARDFAKASAGVPRQAAKLVTTARDHADAGMPVTGPAVLASCRITPDGYTRRHLDVLSTIRNLGGQAGLKVISDMVGMSPREVEDTERALIRTGALRRTKSGRLLTAHGNATLTNYADQL